MRAITFDELCSLVKSYLDKEVLITFHSIGDRDAVGSAVALSRYLPKSILATPDFLTSNARHMLALADYGKNIGSKFEDKDAVIVMDANNREVLGKFGYCLEGFKGDVLFIDHHITPRNEDPATLNAKAFCDESYNSTASVIYDLLIHNNSRVDKTSAVLLLNGIIADSADLQNADSKTFMQISELLPISQISYSQISEYYHETIPVGNRFMTINDEQKAKAEEVGRYVIVYGRASAHANIDADAALSIGADASVFWAVTETEATVSARLRSPLDKVLGVHLGELMQDVATLVGGTGGGHPCAAGAYGHSRENAEKAGLEIVAALKGKMGARR